VRFLPLQNTITIARIKKIKPYIFGHAIDYIHGHEKLIKIIEYIRGLYRYPDKMLGRVINITNVTRTDVLVIAAHHDDDILGVGTTLYRHSLKGDNIKVLFVTNGTGRGGESWHVKKDESKNKSDIRFQEAVDALSLINVPKGNIFCLGYPDGGTQRYLRKISIDIQELIKELNPGKIYVHCIEGGHRDHDLTSLAVRTVCHKIGYSNVFEWTEYHPTQPLGTQDVKFLPTKHTKRKEEKIVITEEERVLKRKMLDCHRSQDVERYYTQGEAIRKADNSKAEIEIYEQYKSRNKLISILKKYNKYLVKM
jgi:LmbE family N-acetylglucosaminyl deacetylase